jgi:hypothetical protein
MAGIMFTNGSLVLSGYSEHKSVITGIGGKSINNELPYETAMRETIEELFEFHDIPSELLSELNSNISFSNLISTKNYSMFILSFNDLKLIIRIVNKYKEILTSKVYDIIPSNIEELLFLRKADNRSEFKHLCLLPMEQNLDIDTFFLKDIIRYLKTLE